MFNTIGKNSHYLGLLSAQAISLIGTGISVICLALLAYDLAGNQASMVLSITFAIKILTYIFLSPIFASLAHKLPKQQTLVVLDIIRALLFILIPFVTQVWQVYLLMFCINACSAWFTPQFQGLLSDAFSDKEQYIKALSFSRLAFDLEQIISPMLAAILLGSLSFRLIFMFDAASFIISAILLMFCTVPLKKKALHITSKLDSSKFLGGSRSYHFISGVTQGIQNYLAKPRLRALWVAYLSAASASAMVLVNTVVYVHEILKGGERETALFMMLVGLGSMLIALSLPRWLKRYTPQTFHYLGLLILTFTLCLGSLTPSWLGYVLLCFLLGMGMSAIQTTSSLIIVQTCGDEDNVPYFAAHFSLTHFWWLLTYLLAGFSVDAFGLSGAYSMMGGLSFISLLVYYLMSSQHGKTSFN